jgi:hypothetical protein
MVANLSKAMRGKTIGTVTVRVDRQFRIRVWLAVRLFRLSGWLAWHKVVVEPTQEGQQ